MSLSPRAAFRRLLTAAAIAALMTGPAAAQGNCTVNNQASCTFGNSATYALTITVTAAVRLETTATTITLPTPTGTDFDNIFGTPASLGINVRSNRAWALSLRATTTTWTATGVGARANRPVGDLQWATAPAGPYTNMTTTNVSLGSGAPTAGANSTLYLRGRYSWILDTPGAYSLSVQLTLTAP